MNELLNNIIDSIGQQNFKARLGLPPYLQASFDGEEIRDVLNQSQEETAVEKSSYSELEEFLERKPGEGKLENEFLEEYFSETFDDAEEFLDRKLEGFETEEVYRIESGIETSFFLCASDRENYETQYLHGFIPFRWRNHLFLQAKDSYPTVQINARYMSVEQIVLE